MNVTLISKTPGWMLMQIEADTVCITIESTCIFPPFEEMYTWLGRIRDRQLPAEMIINEEVHSVYLVARESSKKKEAIEFSVEDCKCNSS